MAASALADLEVMEDPLRVVLARRAVAANVEFPASSKGLLVAGRTALPAPRSALAGAPPAAAGKVI